MAKAILNQESVSLIDDAMEQCIYTDYFQGKRGGVSLDFTGFKGTFVRRGHIVIHKPGKDDSHKPMPVTADFGTYEALPADYKYYGFCINGHNKGEVANGVGVRGNRNPRAFDATKGYYDVTPILPALKTALPLVTFLGDND